LIKEFLIAKEIDERYWRVMEKMDQDGTWTDEANVIFERMYANFELRWGKHLKTQ
jgi:hypothetical protein